MGHSHPKDYQNNPLSCLDIEFILHPSLLSLLIPLSIFVLLGVLPGTVQPIVFFVNLVNCTRKYLEVTGNQQTCRYPPPPPSHKIWVFLYWEPGDGRREERHLSAISIHDWLLPSPFSYLGLNMEMRKTFFLKDFEYWIICLLLCWSVGPAWAGPAG